MFCFSYCDLYLGTTKRRRHTNFKKLSHQGTILEICLGEESVNVVLIFSALVESVAFVYSQCSHPFFYKNSVRSPLYSQVLPASVLWGPLCTCDTVVSVPGPCDLGWGELSRCPCDVKAEKHPAWCGEGARWESRSSLPWPLCWRVRLTQWAWSLAWDHGAPASGLACNSLSRLAFFF